MSKRFLLRGALLRTGLVMLAFLLVACTPAAPPPATPVPPKPAAPAAATKAPAAQPAAAPAAKAAEPTKAPVLTSVQDKLDDLNKRSGAERQKFLEEQAIKEGKLVMYSSADEGILKKWSELLKAKYPQIDVQLLRMSTRDIPQRSLAESQAGRPAADIINPPGAETVVIQKAGLLAKYISPESKEFDIVFKDPNGYWVTGWHSPEVVGFNTSVVKKADVPTDLDGLANPALKGKLGRTSMGDRWAAAIIKVKGEAEGMALLRKIADLSPRLFDSNTALRNALTVGQVPIAFDTHFDDIATMSKEGAPVDFVQPEPLFVYSQYIAIAKDAPHPYAAALVYDWLISRDGQAVLLANGRTGPRKDMDYPTKDIIGKAKTIVTYSPDLLKDVEKYQKIFEDLYIRK